MVAYVIFDADGEFTGFMGEVLHPPVPVYATDEGGKPVVDEETGSPVIERYDRNPAIPETAIAISQEVYDDFLANQGRRKWDAEAKTFVAFEPPPPPEPPMAPLSARQFRLGLHANGLLSSVQGSIDALDEPDKTAAQIEWEYATQIERDHPLVQNLSAQLGLTDEQIDAMWRAAAAF